MYQPSRKRIERLTAIFRERHIREREQQENWTVHYAPRRIIRYNDRGLSDAQRVKRGEMDTDPSNQ
jgi:hypothetical protein